MKKENDLKWVSETGATWISVEPTSGEGKENVTISVENSKVWEYPRDLESTVTFRCTNCDTLTEEEKTKTVPVCRCACSCCNLDFSNQISQIPETGLNENAVLLTYSIKTDCSEEAVAATITCLYPEDEGHEEVDLVCEDGKVTLQYGIPHNQYEAEIPFKVKVYFDKDKLPDKNSEESGLCEGCCNPCKEFIVSQMPLTCDCNTTIKNDINITNYIKYLDEYDVDYGNFPQSGLTAGEIIFNYRLKKYCSLSNMSSYFEYEEDGQTHQVKLEFVPSTDSEPNIAKGEAVLMQALPPNNSPKKRNLRFVINYKTTDSCIEINDLMQNGCDCETSLDSFNVCISTFGVSEGDKVGEFSMDQDTTCSVDNIRAYLKDENEVEKPLNCVLTEGTRSGEIYLKDGYKIEPNIEEKTGRDFQLLVYYGSIENPCIETTITQNGVTCNCGDLNFSFNDEYIESSTQKIVFPQTGISENTQIAYYTFKNQDCSDCNKCVDAHLYMINDDDTETETEIETEFEGDKLYLRQTINENENVIEINFKLYIKYNTLGKGEPCFDERDKNTWIDCDPIYIKQKGIECSCDNVKIEPTDVDRILSLPVVGTNGKFVQVATVDTGIYSKTHKDKLLAACGKIFGYCSYTGLTGPEEPQYIDDNKIKTDEIPDGDNPTHKYSIKVNFNSMVGSVNLPFNLTGNIYYFEEGEDPLLCPNKIFKIKIDDNICDCITPQYEVEEVACEGSQDEKILLLTFNNVHQNMYIGAEVVETETPAITNIEVKRVTGSSEDSPRNVTVSIYGNVSENDTSDERTVGELKITTICCVEPITTEFEPQEADWVCQEEEIEKEIIPIKQVKCPTCDCAEILDTTKSTFYVDSQDYESENIHIPYNLDEYKYKIASFWGKKNCLDIRIDGQRKCIEEDNECDEYDNDIEWLYEYYEEEGETKLWYKVRIEKRYETYWSTVYENFYLIFKMYAHRTTSNEDGGITPPQLNLLIGFNTKDQEEQTVFNQCSAFTKVVNDNACDCDTFKSLANVDDPSTYKPYYNEDGEYNPDLGSNDGKYTLKFNGGQLEATYVAFPLEYGDCLEVYIRNKEIPIGEDGWIMTTYTYPEDGPAIYTAVVTSSSSDYEYENVKNAIKVTFTDVVTEDYTLRIVIGYKKITVDEYGQETITFVPCQEADLVLDVCECDRNEFNACNKNFKLDISKNSTTGSTYVVNSNRDCIKILLYDDANNYYHLGENYEYKVNGNTLFTANVYGDGSWCDVPYTAFMVKVALENGVNLGSQTYTLKGKYYTDGPKNNGQCNDIICKKDANTDCEFTVTVSQSNCNCEEDVHNRICDTSITYSNCSQENSVAVYGKTCLSDYSAQEESCARVKFYLISNYGQPGEEYELYDGNEEGGYPPPYNEYLDVMPQASTSTQHITFTQPYQGDDQRVTHFIGIWVDNNDKPIIIQDGEQEYKCGEEFTVTETFKADCSCICDCENLRNYMSEITFKLNPRDGGYECSSSEEVREIFSFNIDKKVYDEGCIKVDAILGDEMSKFTENPKIEYDESSKRYTVTYEGYLINHSGQDIQVISINIYIKNNNCENKFDDTCGYMNSNIYIYQ